MKYKVFEDKRASGSTVYLKLTAMPSSTTPMLEACDEYGKPLACGKLLYINSNGNLRLCIGISDELGLKLDGEGRLALGGSESND